MNLFGFNLKMFGRRQAATHPTLMDIPDSMGGNDQQSAYAAWDWFYRQMEVEAERRRRYETYYRMDLTDLVVMVADQYADDCTSTMPELGHKVWFDSPSPDVMQALAGLHKGLQLDENAFAMTRQLALYGDDFERMVYARGKGVMGLQWGDPRKITRQEDKYRRLVGFKQEGMRFKQDKNQEVSWPWDYVHFRIMGKDRSSCYGTSIFHGAIRPWKQCTRKDSIIWTPDGPVKVQDIKAGSTVCCVDPETKEVRNTTVLFAGKTGTKKVVRIRTQHREIEVTHDHPMLVERSGNTALRYVEAGDLVVVNTKKGAPIVRVSDADHLVLPVVVDGADDWKFSFDPAQVAVGLRSPVSKSHGIMEAIRMSDLSVTDKNAHSFLRAKREIGWNDFKKLAVNVRMPKHDVYLAKSRKESTLPLDGKLAYTADQSFARFLGFMLGDGWFTGTHGFGFALSVYPEMNAKYITLAKKLFNLDSYTEVEAKPGSGGAVLFHSKAAYLILKSAGFITGFDKKVVPAWIFKMSLDARREFIRGICDADGQPVNGGNHFGVSNRSLIEGVQTLCQMSGMRVSRKIGPNGYVGKGGPHKSSPDLTCPVQRAASFRIFISEPKSDEDTDVVYEAVTSVEEVGECDVYDITVADPVHNFIANGVAVHNCMMAEDELLFYRLNRRYDRDHHYVDTGTNDEVEQTRILQRYMKRFRRQEHMDPNTKQYEFNFRPVSPSDDLFIPMHDQSQTRVERVSGNPMAGEIRDIIYYLDKYFGSVKTPKEMFGFLGEDASLKPIDLRKKLTSQNIVYARAVQRVQHAFKTGLREIAEIHLDLLDNDPQSAQYDYTQEGRDFKIKMEPVSYLAEFERLDLLQLRTGVATAMLQMPATSMNINSFEMTAYVLKNVMQFSDAEVQSMVQQAAAVPPQAGESASAKGEEKITGNDSLQRLGDALASGKKSSKYASILESVVADPKVAKAIMHTKLLFENKPIEPVGDAHRRGALTEASNAPGAVMEDVANDEVPNSWSDIGTRPEGSTRDSDRLGHR